MIFNNEFLTQLFKILQTKSAIALDLDLELALSLTQLMINKMFLFKALTKINSIAKRKLCPKREHY